MQSLRASLPVRFDQVPGGHGLLVAFVPVVRFSQEVDKNKRGYVAPDKQGERLATERGRNRNGYIALDM